MSISPDIVVNRNSQTGVELESNDSTQLGEFVANTTYQFYIFVGNIQPDSVLTIPFGGITIDNSATFTNVLSASNVNGTLIPGSSISLPVNITNGNGIYLFVTLTTSALGSKSFTLNILSNDTTNVQYSHTFYFSVVAASTTSPTVQVVYANNFVENDGVIDLGDYAYGSTNNFTFRIYNFGIPNLSISTGDVSITTYGGTEYFITEPTESNSISVAFNSNALYAIRLDTSVVGEKSFVVTIISNDTENSPYVFTVTYEIKDAYYLDITESSETVVEDSVLEYGTIARNTITNKTIKIVNSGILYGIKISNILISGNVRIVSLPQMPVVLQPNSANNYSFSIKLDTVNLGNRSANFSIQWEVIT